MDNLKFQRIKNNTGQISELEIGGCLILENAETLKKEFVDVSKNLSSHVSITISGIEEIDIPCIQLFMGLIKKMNKLKVKYELKWEIDEEQELLLKNVGLNDEFFTNNSYD